MARRKKRSAHEHRRSYIVLQDMEFGYTPEEIEEFDELWNAGISLWDIAKRFKRDPDEMVLVVLDRIRKGALGKRKGGLFGDRVEEMNKIINAG